MSEVNKGWSPVDAGGRAFTYLYSFGPGLAHALAVRGEAGFVVVSPPCRAPEAAFAELEGLGKIAALVASNAYHHLGIAPWKARFPEAAVFAPAQSIARVAKQSKLPGIRPLAEAVALCGAEVELIDMPHYKTGELLVRFRSGAELVWYTTDVLMNFPKLPKFPIGTVFKWTGSAPGLRLNGFNPFFMMHDKHAVWRWLKAEAERLPPTLVIPCHGDRVKMDPPGRELLAAIAERVS
jgi:hypothetical protein